jgi:predicted dienelactone hydrolase
MKTHRLAAARKRLMRLILLTAASVVTAAYPLGAEISPAGFAYCPGLGPYHVKQVDMALHDVSRGKVLPINIRYPDLAGKLEAQGPFPVILFSHGAGDSKEGAPVLSQYWCSHGYVCIHPTHAGKRAPRKKYSLVRFMREFERLRELGPRAWEDRVADLKLVMDSLSTIERELPDLAGKMAPDQIGVGGHSLGAYTALLVGGTVLFDPDLAGKPATGEPLRYRDDRVKAVLVLSGPGRDRHGLTEHSWEHMTIPMMVMTGSRDPGLLGQSPRQRTESFLFAPPGDKYLVYIEGAHHLSCVGPLALPRSPSKFLETEPGQLRATSQRAFFYARCATLAFWDTYLKHKPEARSYLGSDALKWYSEGSAELDAR